MNRSTKWIEPVPVETSPLASLDVPEVVRRMLVRRGIDTLEAARKFMDPDQYALSPNSEMPDLERAAQRIKQANQAQEQITIWGDFDADGQTSTTILVSALSDLGCKVDYYIPHREREGHGMNNEGLDQVKSRGGELVITCDCGVADIPQIEHALAIGLDVIITDHHELPPELPTIPVVNPQRLDDDHPAKPMCGVGVAYRLLQEVYRLHDRTLPDQYLDLVALGTIADVASLVDDNRCMTQRGLEIMSREPRPGIAAVLKATGRDLSFGVTTRTIGFDIAPRLNAVGRLAHANEAVELLLSDGGSGLKDKAARFDMLNDERKEMCARTLDEAVQIVERDPNWESYPITVIENEGWHPGVIGIVCSQLVERYNRPAFLISLGDDGIGRASGRSTADVHLQRAIVDNMDHLVGGGGHAMAAGFKIKRENIREFKQALMDSVARQVAQSSRPRGKRLEDYVKLGDIDNTWKESVLQLEPFGAGNPRPLWGVRRVRFVNIDGIGAARLHSRAIMEDEEGHKAPVKWWRRPPDEVPRDWCDAVIQVDTNVFRNQMSYELNVVDVDVRQPEPFPTELFPVKNQPVFVDARNKPLQEAIAGIPSSDLMIWAEGGVTEGRKRSQLRPAKTLVLAAFPPDPETIDDIVERVNPSRIIVATGQPPAPDSVDAFIKKLRAELATVIQKQQGKTTLLELAERIGSREFAVREGLKYMDDIGKLEAVFEGDAVQILPPKKDAGQTGSTGKIRFLLKETEAYHRHFAKAPLDHVMPSGER